MQAVLKPPNFEFIHDALREFRPPPPAPAPPAPPSEPPKLKERRYHVQADTLRRVLKLLEGAWRKVHFTAEVGERREVSYCEPSPARRPGQIHKLPTMATVNMYRRGGFGSACCHEFLIQNTSVLPQVWLRCGPFLKVNVQVGSYFCDLWESDICQWSNAKLGAELRRILLVGRNLSKRASAAVLGRTA